MLATGELTPRTLHLTFGGQRWIAQWWLAECLLARCTASLA
jgi:hypothetical protein